jgi:hypothetical protein
MMMGLKIGMVVWDALRSPSFKERPPLFSLSFKGRAGVGMG